MIYTYDALELNGRLGNQLWQIAWQIGQAALKNDDIYIKPDWRYREYFSIPDQFFAPKAGKKKDGGHLYYQELLHWQHIKDEIWEYFQPSVTSIEYLESNYPSEFLDTRIHKTSIHCRRGDFLQNPTRFPVPSDRYYDHAIELALDKNPETLFMVFSDDYKYIRRRFKGENFLHIEGIASHADPNRRGSPQDQWDLFIMTCCQQHIIANSTFSWWGAFLAESEAVYYPSVWFGPDIDAVDSRGIDIKESWRDGIPNDWFEISC